MSNDTYQGYENRETWATILYINNDVGLRDFALNNPEEEIRNYFEDLEGLMIEGQLSRDGCLMLTDIGSLWRVDWRDVKLAFPSEGE